MIISHKYKFIFIKTLKTAGTSLEVFLSQCCGDGDIVTPIWPHVEPHRARNYQGLWNPFSEIFYNNSPNLKKTLKDLSQQKKYYNHISASLIKSRTSKAVWNSYFKFCVERNPWDKTLSHYHMVNDRAGGGISIDDYIKQGNFCINVDKYTDRRNNLLVDKVVKYEFLIDHLSVIFQELGIPFEGSLGVRAKSEHRKDRMPYQEVFSFDQGKAVQMAFRREIEMHGYEF